MADLISMRRGMKAWTAPWRKCSRPLSGERKKEQKRRTLQAEKVYVCKHKVAKPTVFIPVFPGTNCE